MSHYRAPERYELNIRQEPSEAKAFPTTFKSQTSTRISKWPLDPPPVVELNIAGQSDATDRAFLFNPHLFCTAEIDIIEQDAGKDDSIDRLMSGTTVSSLHRQKENERERGYFVFGDLNLRYAGKYRLKFSLFEIRQNCGSDTMIVQNLGGSVYSKVFRVICAKAGLSPRESTAFSRKLVDAGIKLRLRKNVTRKRRAQNTWAATMDTMVVPPSMLTPGIPQIPYGAHHPAMGFIPHSGESLAGRVSYSHNETSQAQPQAQIHGQAQTSDHSQISIPAQMHPQSHLPPQVQVQGRPQMHHHPQMQPPHQIPSQAQMQSHAQLHAQAAGMQYDPRLYDRSNSYEAYDALQPPPSFPHHQSFYPQMGGLPSY